MFQWWNRYYRLSGYLSLGVGIAKPLDPPLFQMYPEIKKMISEYCYKNFAGMLVVQVHKELCTAILLNLAKTEDVQTEIQTETQSHGAHPNFTSLGYDKYACDSENELVKNSYSIVFRRCEPSSLGKQILLSYLLHSPSTSTVWRCLKCSGFTYDTKQK